MKKQHITTIMIALFIVIVGVFSSVYIYNQKENEIQMLMSEKADLNQLIEQKDSVMIDAENTFSEIESTLRAIKEKRNEIALIQKEGGKSRKQAVIEDIQMMNTLLEESNKKIADLQARLKKSGINIKAFEQRIAALNETIDSQNNEIAELKRVVEDKNVNLAKLNTKVDEMNTVIAQKADTITNKQKQIVERTNELNTAHVAVGTYKQLKEEGLLAKEGGILGLGASKSIQENFDNKYFTTLDIRTTKTIPLNTKKVKVISEHPVSSYSLIEENGQIAYLQIDNPAEFWKISKYAVIELR
ncbi:MAG: hypothetical protein WAO52_01570 [Prolixibacteraceae bacterium]